MDSLKSFVALKECLVLPCRYPQLFSARKNWHGIILYGPAGCGKTYLAMEAVKHIGNSVSFQRLHASDLRPHRGDTGNAERKLTEFFDGARKLLPNPVILFIDDFDFLFHDESLDASRRIKTEFLVQFDGTRRDQNLFIVVASDKPWNLCCPVRKRFEKLIYVGLPDYDTRLGIIQKQFSTVDHNLTDEFFNYLALNTEGLSCADLIQLIRDAAMGTLRKFKNSECLKKYMNSIEADSEQRTANTDTRGTEPHNFGQLHNKHTESEILNLLRVTKHDVDMALEQMKPSVCQETIEKFQKFHEEYGTD